MAELRNIVQGTLLENEPMSRHTSYGIGGPAAAYITPKDRYDLGEILKFANQNFQAELKTSFLERKDLLDEYTFNIIRVKNKGIAYELYFRLDSDESDFTNLSESFAGLVNISPS